MKILGKLTGKHFDALVRYFTFPKLFNIILCEYEKKRRLSVLRSMPYTATIDVTNVCNLSCPYCPTGANKYGRKPTMIDLKKLDIVLDELGKTLIIANLYNWGESLLHPKIGEIVSMFHKKGIFTSISTNLNIKNKRTLEIISDAGLDYLVASADGATHETYVKYRRRGNFNLLLENLKYLIKYRKTQNRKTPYIEWQFRVFKHNEHEINDAEKLAKNIGVDKLNVVGGVGPEKSQSLNPELRGKFQGGDNFCLQLWHNIAIQADGGVVPCCQLYSAEDDFDKIGEKSIKEMRNSDLFVKGRNFFNPDKVDSLELNIQHPCIPCPILKLQGHLKNFLKENPDTLNWESAIGVMKKHSK